MIRLLIMKRFLYFDPFNGTSGDMILGALVDLGLPLDTLRQELDKLHLEEYSLVAEPLQREGLRGTNLRVQVGDREEDPSPHPHFHNSHRHGRTFSRIRELIESSSLDPWVKEKSVAIFRRLAEAEARVHGTSLEKVHFHEVGAVDAIVDIVGACIGFHHFRVEEFYTAPLELGGGTVTFSHGTWPVPAPATVELTRGFPVSVGAAQAELTTPTGAAIITTLARPGRVPGTVQLERSGFGAGDKELPGIPNMLRLMMGYISDRAGEEAASEIPFSGVQEEEVVLFETNIDDMDAEMCGHFLERALQRGALDVFYTPVQMKKNRPGLLLSVLCARSDQQRMAELIFRETTTLGLRWRVCRRWVLEREVKTVQTEYGPVRVKLARFQGRTINVAPEHEDLRRLAEQTNLPLKTLRQKVFERITDVPS